MCTLTYIPKGENGFMLTQNRDESPKRSAPGLIFRNLGKHQLLFPQDSGAGGTWLAASDQNQFVALLNGAFIRHRHRPPYRRSRGLMVLDFFAFANTTAFCQQYTFEGMEPFTMISYDKGVLHEIRWDQQQLHLKNMDAAQAHLWASSTLYPPPIQQKRQDWFANWLNKQRHLNSESVLDFHQNAGDGDPANDLVMNRNNIVCTTSISSIVKSESQIDMHFHDLLHQNTDSQAIKLTNEHLATHQK